MEELTKLLNEVSDTYYDFVSAMLKYAAKKETREAMLIDYLKSNKNLTTSDVIQFVSSQEDFREDAACAQAM